MWATKTEETEMKCTSKVQAERIAKAGAAKMDREGYRIENSGLGTLYNKQFRVHRADAATAAYAVCIESGKTFCQCAFYRENKEFGTCKHIERCREEAEMQAWCDEQTEMLNDMYPVIPPATSRPAVCPQCGTSNPFDNDSTCPRCEKYAQI
jgi:hypothetical protein